MKHYLAVVLFCLGLILFRTPLSFSDYSGTAGNEEYGLAYGSENCRNTWDGDDDCVQDLYQAAQNNAFCIVDTPYCQCEYLGLNCDSGTDPGDGGGLTQEQLDAIAAVIIALQNAQSYANNAAGYL